MKPLFGTAHIAAIGLAMLAFGFARTASAEVIIDFTEVADSSQTLGYDVVADGSGTLDTTDLNCCDGDGYGYGFVDPSNGAFSLAGSSPILVYDYAVSGPLSFGSGSQTDVSSGSGDGVGLYDCSAYCDGIPTPTLLVSPGYTSGSEISGTDTWDDATFASLGLTPGTYTWTWGSGLDADSFVINIGAESQSSTPEPATLGLLASALLVLGAGRRIVRRSN